MRCNFIQNKRTFVRTTCGRVFSNGIPILCVIFDMQPASDTSSMDEGSFMVFENFVCLALIQYFRRKLCGATEAFQRLFSRRVIV